MKKNRQMTFKSLLIPISALLLVGSNNAVLADEKPIDSYYARLSKQDHYNSAGNLLTKVEGIIQQDRANVYVFEREDHEDNQDFFFANKDNRALIGTLIANSTIDENTAAKIINGTPLVFVKIYKGYLNITVVSE